jgi:hypothetical protein
MPLEIRRWPSLGLVTLAALAASAVANAHLIDLFFGMKPLLHQRARMEPNGLALQGSFSVSKKCPYDFELRLRHQQMHELDAAIGGMVFPVPVTLRVSQEGKDELVEVVHLERAPPLTGHGQEMTIFTIGAAPLERGRYRVDLESAAVPTLTNVDIDFVVQLRPKTSC